MIFEFLNHQCGVCSYCVSFVTADHDKSTASSANSKHATSAPSSSEESSNGNICTVCFGLSSPSHQKERILPIVRESLLPYCRSRRPGADDAIGEAGESTTVCADQGNHLTRESPTVNLPWLIAARAHCAISAAKWFLGNGAGPSERSGVRLRTAEEVHLRIKEHLRSSLRILISGEFFASNCGTKVATQDKAVLSQQLHKEEAGYLGIHILFLPPDVGSVEQVIPPSLHAHLRQQSQRIQKGHHRILNPRKRFRGNDPTLKQGGDPRSNLELRVKRRKYKAEAAISEKEGIERRCSDVGGGMSKSSGDEVAAATSSCSSNGLHEWNMIISLLEKNTVLQWVETESSRAGSEPYNHREFSTWLRSLHEIHVSLHGQAKGQLNSAARCSIHAATWRRPFYVKGTYTKSRRDVSQTPFYVPATTKKSTDANNGNGTNGRRMVRRGITSVEDEICAPLALVGCGGISEWNNAHPPSNAALNSDDGEKSVDEKGAVVYGMCKFHASGREDADVRMLLPPPSVAKAGAKSNVIITGRPFVCEVFDAHRIPSGRDLENVARAINYEEGTAAPEASPCEEDVAREIQMDEKGWPRTLAQPHRYHGNSPRGVGVSRPLGLVPSGAFSGLQSESEEKVKYYGCVCWTSAPVATEEELIRKLGCSPWNKEEEEAAGSALRSDFYPLKIRQSTPLRVLHRRSSDVRTRHILSLSACRINDHWFRLRMSTSAGTYVKEFVHGDCGRTRPSIGSMLGGRADITELDCEGIAA